MITGGMIKRVEAQRLKEGAHQTMDVNIRVKEVKFEKSKVIVSYIYDINYQPQVATMSIEGEVYFEESEKEVKEIKELWASKNQLPEQFSSDFLTALTYTCSTVGTLLAFAININAPINVPRAKIGQKVDLNKGAS